MTQPVMYTSIRFSGISYFLDTLLHEEWQAGRVFYPTDCRPFGRTTTVAKGLTRALEAVNRPSRLELTSSCDQERTPAADSAN